MWTWGMVAAGIGLLLLIFEWQIARRKKEGITWTDKQRLFGIFKIAVVLTVVAGLIGWALE